MDRNECPQWPTCATERVSEYLIDVVTRLEAGFPFPLAELHDLVPDVWLAKKTADQSDRETATAAA